MKNSADFSASEYIFYLIVSSLVKAEMAKNDFQVFGPLPSYLKSSLFLKNIKTRFSQRGRMLMR